VSTSERGRDVVTVGIPTYNAEATIATTIATLLAQRHRALEIIVSDNASTDRTVGICRDAIGDDHRVRVVCHERNRGWQFNFRFLLAEANGPYFMWLGSDDLLAPTFVSDNLARLTADARVVTSVCRVRWLHDGRRGEIASGTAPLEGTPRQNAARYIRHARDNSRFYGLHRTAALRASFPAEDFYGLDIAIMLGTLRFGTHAEVPDVLLERERHAPGSYAKQIERDSRGLMDRVLPLGRFSRAVLFELKVPMSPQAIGWLIVRNAFEHARYWGGRGGPYGRPVGALAGIMERRRAAITTAEDTARTAGSRPPT